MRVALLGNPNTGKTTLFNLLCGVRAKTSNFPGTTLEARLGRAGDDLEVIDLPGVYSLDLDQHEARVVRETLTGTGTLRGSLAGEPDVVCVVLDATNLRRSLMLAGEAARLRKPLVLALNLSDVARRRGLAIDAGAIAESLGCPVVPCGARRGEGIDDLRRALAQAKIPVGTPPGTEEGLRQWSEDLHARAATLAPDARHDTLTDRLDQAFTHPVLGVGVFALVMTGLFWVLFKIATYPMDLIDSVFSGLAAWVEGRLPEGVVGDLLAHGVVSGIGATVIFLPQICLLFFVISILEGTGYLARAAFVMDRVLRPFGLPGHAFVPLLSSHACALPGIMATRAIPDRKERLATILVAPFMTCSARLPVYVLVTTLLFPRSPALAALAFVGCYALGIAAGVLSALLARRTILRGRARPMALELPSYAWPSLRTAMLTTLDRAMVFIRQAGTNILAICIVLWWLSSYPKVDPPEEAIGLRAAIVEAERTPGESPFEADPVVIWNAPNFPGMSILTLDEAGRLADQIEARHAAARSFAGRLGRAIQPVFEPLGYDWRLSVGILTSFAAREVFVSTMAVVITGEDEASEGILERIAAGERDDGRAIFTPAVSWSLLVYYVLAMQCLPTLAVTARESGSWKWAALQQAWMSGIAYLAAMLVFQVLR